MLDVRQERLVDAAQSEAELMRAIVLEDKTKELARLRQELDSAKRKWSAYNVLNRAGPGLSLLLAGALFAIFLWSGENIAWLYASAFYAAIALALPILNFGEAGRAEIETIETEIILRTTGAEAVEQRAERLFKSHEIDLRRYYQQTLRHSNIIFFAGVGCIAVGFGIIGYCLYVFTWAKPGLGIDSKVLLAAFGIISGVLTNFVAIIYLKIFSKVVEALSVFHGKLVETNHLHFANLLLSKVSKAEVRDQTLSQLALELGINQNAVREEHGIREKMEVQHG